MGRAMVKREDRVEYHRAVEDDVLTAMKKPGPLFWVALFAAASFFGMGMALWVYQILTGMGVSGLNNPVGWGVYITDFVFWVGIAHSGTLISAVLFLFRAKFRSAFNRSAEAMTVFAVMTAGLFPLIHLGRTWFFFWLLPYPNQRLLWVNFRSPLMWDVFAVSTYFTISAVFFFVGLIPDLAIAKRQSTGIRKWLYSALSLGWVGSFRQWKHYRKLYMFLAAFATPLVVSVHSVVSWDFAMAVLPGWHTTIFAPYFVAGAIFSGTAMVITLVVPMRRIFGLHRHITIDHFESIAKILLFTSLLVTYSYIVEFALALYSGNVYEAGAFLYRLNGDYRYLYWGMLLCNSAIPFTLFVKKLRRSLPFLYVLSIFVNIGMWLERFVIITTALSKDFDPYSWGTYKPALVEVGITLGSFGFFFMLFLLFTKLLPVVAISELKEVADE
jgi:Ni/Fe-hydrogenase subunit HybB-like protein